MKSLAKQMEELGENLRNFRKDKGLSIEKFAEKSNTSHSTVWNLENSRAKGPSVFLVKRMAYTLGVSLEMLLVAETDEKDEDRLFLEQYKNLSKGSKIQLQKILKTFT